MMRLHHFKEYIGSLGPRKAGRVHAAGQQGGGVLLGGRPRETQRKRNCEAID